MKGLIGVIIYGLMDVWVIQTYSFLEAQAMCILQFVHFIVCKFYLRRKKNCKHILNSRQFHAYSRVENVLMTAISFVFYQK